MTNSIYKSNSNMTIALDVMFFEQDEYWIAYCPALELSAYANSEDAARKSFEIEMKIFVEESHRNGTFEKYLLKTGWKLQQVPEINYIPPKKKKALPSFLSSSKTPVSHHNVKMPVYA